MSALRAAHWADEDCGIGAFAQGVGMLMNIAGTCDGESDHDSMRRFEEIVRELMPTFKVANRACL